MKRILCIMSNSMDAGGAETFLMKVFRNIDRNKCSMDFYVSEKKKGFYDDEIVELGGKIFYSESKAKNFIKAFLSLRKVVKLNKYKYIIRVADNSFAVADLLASKLGGAKVLAFRSSNSNISGSWFRNFLHFVFKPFCNLISNVKIAPSSEAAIFMFGKRKLKKVNILHNGLDFDLYKFDNTLREKYRLDNGWSDKIVVGHVGRLIEQKNHYFMLKVFEQFLKLHPNSRLVLVGCGELQDEIKNQAGQMNILDKIDFLGVRSDVPKLMMAMDVFLFPSFYEGMPNVLIEAQASGLHCLTSDKVTKEANITGLVSYMSLDQPPAIWADILNSKIAHSRINTQQFFRDNYYDIDSVAAKFSEIIFDGRKV